MADNESILERAWAWIERQYAKLAPPRQWALTTGVAFVLVVLQGVIEDDISWMRVLLVVGVTLIVWGSSPITKDHRPTLTQILYAGILLWVTYGVASALWGKQEATTDAMVAGKHLTDDQRAALSSLLHESSVVEPTKTPATWGLSDNEQEGIFRALMKKKGRTIRIARPDHPKSIQLSQSLRNVFNRLGWSAFPPEHTAARLTEGADVAVLPSPYSGAVEEALVSGSNLRITREGQFPPTNFERTLAKRTLRGDVGPPPPPSEEDAAIAAAGQKKVLIIVGYPPES